MERPIGLIYFPLSETTARFYLGVLRAYQDRRIMGNKHFDLGVAEDIKWLEKEMELRGWSEAVPVGEED